MFALTIGGESCAWWDLVKVMRKIEADSTNFSYRERSFCVIILDADNLRALFTKPYGQEAPTEAQWRELYDDKVRFQDPTQEREGIKAYIDAQDSLVRRCDDVYLIPGAIAIDGDTAFVEWEMGLKIKGIEFVYPGTSRLRFNQEGKVCDHRDYFDFVAPTFEPVPVVGGFVRWLYKRFVD